MLKNAPKGRLSPYQYIRRQALSVSTGLSRTEEALRAGVTPQRWNDLLRGKSTSIGVDALEYIAKGLNVEMWSLLKGYEEQ